MLWAAVAAGAVVSMYGAYQAGEQADKDRAMMKGSMSDQNRIAQERLDFEREQYDKWEEIYGPIQQNLSEFWQGMDEATFTASGLEEQKQAYETTKANLDRNVAQRNIDSPATAMLEQGLDISFAESQAKTRHEAPLLLAQAKQGFLSNGVSNPGAPGVSNAYGAQSAAYSQQASQYSSMYAKDRATEAAGWSATGKAIGSAAYLYGAYGGGQQNQPNKAEGYDTSGTYYKGQ